MRYHLAHRIMGAGLATWLSTATLLSPKPAEGISQVIGTQAINYTSVSLSGINSIAMAISMDKSFLALYSTRESELRTVRQLLPNLSDEDRSLIFDYFTNEPEFDISTIADVLLREQVKIFNYNINRLNELIEFNQRSGIELPLSSREQSIRSKLLEISMLAAVGNAGALGITTRLQKHFNIEIFPDTPDVDTVPVYQDFEMIAHWERIQRSQKSGNLTKAGYLAILSAQEYAARGQEATAGEFTEKAKEVYDLLIDKYKTGLKEGDRKLDAAANVAEFAWKKFSDHSFAQKAVRLYEAAGKFAKAGTLARQAVLSEEARRNYDKYEQQAEQGIQHDIEKDHFAGATRRRKIMSNYFEKEQEFERAARHAEDAGLYERARQLNEKALQTYERQNQIAEAADLSYRLLVAKVGTFTQERTIDETVNPWSDNKVQGLLERTLRHYDNVNPARAQLIAHWAGVEESVPFFEQATDETATGLFERLGYHARGGFDAYHDVLVDRGMNTLTDNKIVREELRGGTPVREAALDAMEKAAPPLPDPAAPWYKRFIDWMQRDVISKGQYQSCN